MRIVYMGSPDFAVLPLQKIVEAGHEVVAVYTQPDRPRGKRGKEMLPTAVKAAALELGIPVYSPANVNTPEALEQLAALRPQLLVVVAYGQILKPQLLAIPTLGAVNIHGSLLPAYRGAAPIQRAIMNGDTVSGVTIMYLDEGMDSGDMILRRELPLAQDETYGSLHDKLQQEGSELLLEALALMEQGKAPRIPQEHEKATYAPKISREEELLEWSMPAAHFAAIARGLDPFPGAYVLRGGKRLKIFACAVAEGYENHDVAPGTVLALDEEGMIVACGNGAVYIGAVHPEGKTKMCAAAFARGYQIKTGGKM